LLIKLPVHPSTIEELALIRFWLLKLSQTHFEDMYAYRGILNPEFISVINPRTGPKKILFHTNEVVLGGVPEDQAAIPAVIQVVCARQIYLRTPLLNEPCQNNLFRFITVTGNALEKFRINSLVSNQQGEFCEFLVKVNFEIHFYNFQL
jgi:hypothetical protein